MFEQRSSDEEFEYFVAPDDGSLYLAWRRVLSSPILDTKDRLGLKIFSAKTSEHIDILRQEIMQGIYTPNPPMFMKGPKDDKTIRIRTFLDIRDRIVFQALGNIIIENSYAEISKQADKTIFAHIPNPRKKDGTYNEFTFRRTFSTEFEKGQYDKFLDTVFSDIQKASKNPNTWMLETDMASFYPSIDHKLLREMLVRRNWLKNTSLIDLLMLCLGNWSVSNIGGNSGQGVPIGYETSELLATLYLLDIDSNISTPPVMRRFVDDTYIFMEGKKEITEFLVEYDLALQDRSLIRNSSKTRIELCNSEKADKSSFDRTLRKKLSYIKNVLDNQVDNSDQQELLEAFYENAGCTGDCDEQNIKCIHDNGSTLSFILYRLKEKDESVKNVALCMLDELPSKSLHATTYLLLFDDDPDVLRKLFSIIEQPFGYSTVRIDCTKAIIKILGGINDRLTSTLIGWAENSDDWYLRDAAIDILVNHQDVKNFLWDIANSDPCYLIRSKAIYHCFEQCTQQNERIQILNLAFSDENYTVKALGIYLYRREAVISRETINTSTLSDELRSLILSTEDLEEFQLFAEVFDDVFGFEIDPMLSLPQNIPNIRQANQLLLNMQDAASDHIDFVKALHDFALQFLISFIRLNEPRYQASFLRDVLHKIHTDGEEYNTLSKLRDLKELANEGDRTKVDYYNRKEIFGKIRTIFAKDLTSYYEAQKLELPIKLQEYIQSTIRYGDTQVRDKVFISYSHKDGAWLKRLRTHLRPYQTFLNLNVWADTDIKAGDTWKIEIENALKTAKVAVLLVTPDFLASDFIMSKELPHFLKAATDEGLRIIWIAISGSSYDISPLAKYQCANDPDKPLDLLSEGEQNSILAMICKKIQAATT